ncbi:hypothetical protein [Chitinivibrio alkaliphilus]|uniref:DRTGG domain-containing protein n=1 Tax=Chitinivibrio alkaliphilus ACht1 TaxID=1313304 RepID=U7D9H7_9BACT|nr:hypothetical protein [Chitinivibrio alkaliphilus]ERP31742.1 hypothetical protein CALK_1406 [Chitinivibrio alkaliphilus ACht1]
MRVREIEELPMIQARHVPASLADETVGEIMVTELMSDVLTMDHENLLLITSLCSEQALTTANIIDAVGVIITSGKEIPPKLQSMAETCHISLWTTTLRNYQLIEELLQHDPTMGDTLHE